jgi:uncharacterized protein
VYRAVLDQNIFISGTAIPHTPPAQVLDLWRKGAFELITSPQLLAEAEEVFTRPKIMKFKGLSEAETQGLLQEIRRRSYVTKGEYEVDTLTSDPDDNIVLATHIVTGDKKSLLKLKEYHGIRILGYPRKAGQASIGQVL